jgi:asparagine synthase (glutamine-hydrolysing)
MCGIAGFIDARKSLSLEASHNILRNMSQAISHRGPDSSGIWSDFQSGIFLGHQRLAILDLSSAGHQPMESQSKRFQISFNGEIYNHLQLRDMLLSEHKVNHWKGTSDTETLLAIIECYGLKEALKKLDGMFAFALWDSLQKKLFLCRDRFGEKPLYFSPGSANNGFCIFGSELSALKNHPKFNPIVNKNVLKNYINLGYVPQGQCIIAGVSKVLPGRYIAIDPTNLDITQYVYWDSAKEALLAKKNQFKGSFIDASDELEALLIKKISNQMIADVPLGAFLSGGIDSSLVTAIMQSQSMQPIQTFTIGFQEADWDESYHAQRVANILGTNHTESKVTSQDAINIIPHLSRIYSEPFADASQIPTQAVSQIAKKNVVVALTGDAGDEIFCGYDRYQVTQKIWRLISFVPKSLRRSISNAILNKSTDDLNKYYQALQKFTPIPSNIQRPGDKIKKGMSFLSADSFSELYLQNISLWKNPGDIVLGDDGGASPNIMNTMDETLNNVEKAMLFDTLSYLTEDILTKVDRAAMSVSLETRVPFLDHEIYQFAWSLPYEMKFHKGEGKRVLKNILYKYADQEIFERPKMGFGVPVGEWMKGPLRDWAEELLCPKLIAEQGNFCPKIIQQTWDEHVSGNRNWQNQLWTILMFQAWQKDF